MSGANLDRRIGHIIGGDDAVGGPVEAVGQLQVKPLPGGKHRRLAGAKLLRVQLPRFEIVADMLADPQLVFVLEPHLALGRNLAGLLIHGDLVSGQERVAVADQYAVGAPAQARLEIKLSVALVGQRLHFPGGLLLRPGRGGQGQSA